jgi:hypothetical protein
VDSPTVIAFPRPGVARPPRDDAGAAALLEIDMAIAMVAAGAARRVRLTALPFVELAAAEGLAHAGAAGVEFQFERPEREGVATVTIGPLAARLTHRDG